MSLNKCFGGSLDKTRPAEEWIIHFNAEIAGKTSHDNVGAAYAEKIESYRTVIDLSRIPANQIRLYLHGSTDEGVGDIEVYDVTNSQQLAEIANHAAGDNWSDSGWTDLPNNVLGTEITVTLRHKGSATEDIDTRRSYVKLRRN